MNIAFARCSRDGSFIVLRQHARIVTVLDLPYDREAKRTPDLSHEVEAPHVSVSLVAS